MDKTIKQIKDLLDEEAICQEETISLIASENYASQDVLDACGHCIQNRYTEGYVPDPKTGAYRRYYGGCGIVDKIEQLTIDLVCKAFKTKFSNVQSHSGSSANLAVYAAVTKYFKCKPDEVTIISHSLDSGSHLTHGSKASASGKWFNAKQFESDANGYFNYDEMTKLLQESSGPTVLVVGFSAYPREVEYDKIAEIVKGLDKEIVVLCDTSHISGLLVAGLHKSPFDYDWGKAHLILTSTTHKTLRGPRHALITTNDEVFASLIDKSCFPFLQGGALQNMIGALGIAMSEALQPEFKTYAQNLLNNIQAMCKVFKEHDIDMVSGGSDNHLILLDLKKEKFSGADLEKNLESCGIVVNKNAVKNDPRPKMETSGVRLGTACLTTRGATDRDCIWIASQIANVIEMMRDNYPYDGNSNQALEFKLIKDNITEWCKEHPIYE